MNGFTSAGGGKKVIDLGVGTSFNLSTYAGYEKFTADNFVIQGTSSAGTDYTYYSTVSNLEGVAFPHHPRAWINKSYNSATGVLSCYLVASEESNNGIGSVHILLIK